MGERKVVVICGSLDFSHEIKELSDQLQAKGFATHIPHTAEEILRKELSVEQIKQMKKEGSIVDRVIKHDAIRRYWETIKVSDAVLVANFDKKGVLHYVGGNTFLEMGFAHVLKKPLFLLYPVPDMNYRDEMAAMSPIVLQGDIDKLII